jgi:uncharacterized Zn-binding protein involved in type VI secretion
MPLNAQTFSATLAVPYAEVLFGTITPNFDQLDAYADMSPLTGGLQVVWRLYATSGGIRTLAALSGPMGAAFGSQRIFADLAANPATVYELTGELTGSAVPGVTLKAGIVGYDLVVNDSPPSTGTLAFPLVYGVETPVTTLAAYHQQLQVEIDVSSAGAYSASTWRLYAIITGIAGTLTVLMAETRYTPAQNASQKQIVLQARAIGASSYSLTCQGDNPNIALLGAPPVVTGSLTGFSEKLDGTGGGITQLTQDVLAGPGSGSQAATVAKISRSAKLVGKTAASVGSATQTVWEVYQPEAFSSVDVYAGGAPFSCDTGPLATTLIECNFAGAGGTVLLPSPANAGRVLHVADTSATLSLATPLVLQPAGGVSVGGGAPGVALTVTTSGWAQKLVLNSAGDNWMIF